MIFSPVFEVADAVEGCGVVGCNFEAHGPIVVPGAFNELVEAVHGALTALVDYEVACDGKQPGFEAGLAIELATADQNAHPHFLKQIFSRFAIACEGNSR